MTMLSIQTIKGYELREEIGAGSYGVVYRAYQPLVGREVAIKIIHPYYVNQPDFIRRFEAEAHMVAQLEHLHIVPLYDYWREPDGAYLVMRWLRGGNLRNKVLAGNSLSVDALLQILDQIGTALMVAHRHGIVHRDLKPANILLDEDGNAYLADFGIAKDVGDTQSVNLTRPGLVMGSPAYVSPEHIQGKPVTPQTDIYSLGVMLYEILTGELPFHDLTPVAIFYKHLNEPLPFLRQRRPDLPEGLDNIIQRATAKDPVDRYPDVLSLVKDVHRVLAPADGGQVARAMYETINPTGGPPPPSTPNDWRATSSAVKVRSPYETGVIEVPALLDVSTPVLENPYKGLRAFQEADATDFFGRSALTERLLTRMNYSTGLSRFLAVVGPSGSGKSSVVRAALIPALRRGGLPNSEHWFVVEMFPGTHPAEELATALRRVAVKPPANMLEQIQYDEHGLTGVIQQVLPGGSETELLLVIDQFEEIFTLVKEEEARTHLLNSLLTAVTDPASRLRLIITLRADFYDRPLMYGGFGELMRLRTEVVLPLTSEELHQAIVNPAERAGVLLEPELVATIIHDVGEQPGTLPLLQYALTELFERRTGRRLTLAAYNASGGVLGALARRAERLYAELNEHEQEAARQLFLRLVTLGEGTEDTRRRVPRSELTSISGTGEVLDRVIEVYYKHRLLTFDRDPITRGPTVEVAHESLIRTWRRLREWLDASRDDLRRQQRLARWAAEWINADRSQNFLATGARLEQFAAWAAETHIALNHEEQAYLDASLAEHEAQQAKERERRAREAKLERRSRNVLRALVAVLLVATLGALGLTSVALGQRQAAQNNAAAAVTAQGQAVVQAQRAETNAATAATAQAQAQDQATIAKTNAAEAQKLAVMSGAQASLGEGNADQALTLAMAANHVEQPLPQAQLILGDAAYPPGTRRPFAGHKGNIRGVAFSPDGKTALSGATDQTVILWDLATGEAIRRLDGHKEGVQCVAFSPDGQTALSGSNDDTLILWNLATGQPVRTFVGHDGDVLAVAFSPDGTTALSSSRDFALILWDVATAQRLRVFKKHTQPVLAVAFSPDGKTALSASSDTTLILWDVTTGQDIRVFQGHTGEVFSVAFSPDGKTALSGSGDNTLILWNVETAQPIHTYAGHTREVFAVAFSPDGETALSGSRDNKVGLWDVKTGRLRNFLIGHGGAVTSVKFSPDGRTILSGSEDTKLRLWDSTNGAQLRRFVGHTSRINKAIFSPDGKTILSGSGDKTAILWDTASGKIIDQYAFHNDALGSVAFSPDGKTALSGSTDKTVILWDLTTRNVLHVMEGHTKEVSGVAFSPDGKTALSAAGDSTIILWDLATGQQRDVLKGHEEKVNTVTFSPDGQTALSASRDGTVILWDLAKKQPKRVLKGHTSNVRSVVFSPDGKTALSGSEDKTVILWNLATGVPIHSFVKHSASVWDVAFSPDGKTAASGSEDNSVFLWDLESGQAIRRYTGHSAAVRSVAFSPDGKTVLSSSNDGTMILWRVDTLDQLITWTQANRYVPDLTCDQRKLYSLEPLCAENGAGLTSTH
jgi:WD40 repeat protein/serine/threonine protein kinase